MTEPTALERFLQVALDELSGVAKRLDRDAIVAAAQLIRACEADGGRVHVTGIGKPGHIAHYAAALLASTGPPTTFLHGTEVTHGSVGQLRAGDVVIAISNSGVTPELLTAIDCIRDWGGHIVAVTGDPHSPLAQRAEIVISARVEHEGGPLDLAPRASILAQALALQALSVELQAAHDLSRDEYHQRHPAGALGKKSSEG